MRSLNHCRIGKPSLRSGVAVRPSSSTGRSCPRSRVYDLAAAWWNSSTMTTSKWSGRRLCRSLVFRLWIDAKTCSKRLWSKAAALLHSLVKNHALVDGNKRLGWVAVRLFYRMNETDLRVDADEAFDLVAAVADGRLRDVDAIAERLARWRDR